MRCPAVLFLLTAGLRAMPGSPDAVLSDAVLLSLTAGLRAMPGSPDAVLLISTAGLRAILDWLNAVLSGVRLSFSAPQDSCSRRRGFRAMLEWADWWSYGCMRIGITSCLQLLHRTAGQTHSETSLSHTCLLHCLGKPSETPVLPSSLHLEPALNPSSSARKLPLSSSWEVSVTRACPGSLPAAAPSF